MQIYIHIPFCKRKCLYCDFNSFACQPNESILGYLTALNREIELAGRAYGKRGINDIITSVFIGGGTPSLLSTDSIKAILDTIKNEFIVAEDAEITIEANPESLTEEKVVAYKSFGINRLSIGVQSLYDENLRAIGRIHDVNTALSAIRIARKHFDNISCDLMIGLPYDTESNVKAEVDKLASIVNHLSVYQLIVEEGTPLEWMVQKREISLPDDDTTIDLFETAAKSLYNHGFSRYEVSNFAKNGKYSRHNFGYWMREEYLGIGAGASTFLKPKANIPLKCETRFLSRKSVEDYVKDINAAGDYFLVKRENVEELDENAINDERIMLGLRTSKGVDKSLLNADILNKYAEYFVQSGENVALNDRGFAVMNTILVDLLKLGGK